MAVAASGMRSNSVGVLVGVGVSVGVTDGMSVGVGVIVFVAVIVVVGLGVIVEKGSFSADLPSLTMIPVVGNGVIVTLALRHPTPNKNGKIKRMQRNDLPFEKKFDSNIKRSHLRQHKPTS